MGISKRKYARERVRRVTLTLVVLTDDGMVPGRDLVWTVRKSLRMR
jgi:hypothetical protein